MLAPLVGRHALGELVVNIKREVRRQKVIE